MGSFCTGTRTRVILRQGRFPGLQSGAQGALADTQAGEAALGHGLGGVGQWNAE